MPDPRATRRPGERVGERVGVFGGTFDPPHVAHLVAAVNVRHALRLDRVLLVVANVPWQKVGSQAVSPAQDRLAMVAEAVADADGLEASDLEIARGGDSYTIDTVDQLLAEDPTRVVHVIVGQDAAAAMPTWERIDELRRRATLVVVERPGVERPVPSGWAFERVEVPRLEVSSTDLRDRVREGRPLDYLVPPRVVTWLDRRGLYREELPMTSPPTRSTAEGVA